MPGHDSRIDSTGGLDTLGLAGQHASEKLAEVVIEQVLSQGLELNRDSFNEVYGKVGQQALDIISQKLRSQSAAEEDHTGRSEHEPVYITSEPTTSEPKPQTEAVVSHEPRPTIFEYTLSPGESAAFRFDPNEIEEITLDSHNGLKTHSVPGIFAAISPQLPQHESIVEFIGGNHHVYDPLETPIYVMNMNHMRRIHDQQVMEEHTREILGYLPDNSGEVQDPAALKQKQIELDSNYPFRGLLTTNPADPTKPGELSAILWSSNDSPPDYSILHLRKQGPQDGEAEETGSDKFRVTADHRYERISGLALPIAHTVIDSDILIIGVPENTTRESHIAFSKSPFPQIRIQVAGERIDDAKEPPEDIDHIKKLIESIHAGTLIRSTGDSEGKSEAESRRTYAQRNHRTHHRGSRPQETASNPTTHQEEAASSQPSDTETPQTYSTLHAANKNSLSKRERRLWGIKD